MRRPGGTFGIPAALAAATLVALVVGLLDDGVMDVIAWIGLAVPLVAIIPSLRSLHGSRRRAAAGARDQSAIGRSPR